MSRPRAAVLVTTTAVLALAAGCGGSASSDTSARSAQSAQSDQTTSTPVPESPSASTSPTASPTPSGPPVRSQPPRPGPAVGISSIAPAPGSVVGVAMPISIVFTSAVPTAERKQIEKHLVVSTSTPVQGAWHWFGDRRVDFRAEKYWTSGTKVSLLARLGTAKLRTDFTIGKDIRTHVYVRGHRTVVREDGKVIRVMRSNAGSDALPTWTGTMAVVNKSPTVRMDSCSVGLACSPGDPDFYDLTLPWDVRITWSGTFLHYSTGDPNPGSGNGSHGCVHLSLSDAEWFYHLSKPGDPVTVTGSPRAKADPDNGYAGFNLTWPQWVAGSTTGAFTTA